MKNINRAINFKCRFFWKSFQNQLQNEIALNKDIKQNINFDKIT